MTINTADNTYASSSQVVQKKADPAPYVDNAAGSSRVSAANQAQMCKSASVTPSAVLQMLTDSRASEAGVLHEAEQGVQGGDHQLPHLDAIQSSFGHHDVSGVQAHSDGKASQATQNMGAQAYAMGNQVAFNSSTPSLHVAAHEAAHVVQQRSGVQLKGNVGQVGDKYEQHADSVADAVVQGKSAEALLDPYASYTPASAPPLQCYEGGEHMRLGNKAYGSQNIKVGGVSAPAGVFTALMGDFYPDWKSLEAECINNPAAIQALIDVINKEQAEREKGEGEGEHDHAHNHIDSNGAFILAKLRTKGNSTFLELAEANFNHFGENNKQSKDIFNQLIKDNPAYGQDLAKARAHTGENVATWAQQHIDALKEAFKFGVTGAEIGSAIARDAAAAHFLTDAFASGHMRVPRREMFDSYEKHFVGVGQKEVKNLVDNIPDSIDPLDYSPISIPGFMRPNTSINLQGVKQKIIAVVQPKVDSIMKFVSSKIAGFGAKVFHDADNKNGVEVQAIGGGATWTATGDHDLASSKENEERAVAAVAASGAHIKAMHQRGVSDKDKVEKAAADKGDLPIPYLPMGGIIDMIPVPTTGPDSKNKEIKPEDWEWDKAPSSYKAQVLQNAKGAVTGFISSMTEAIGDLIKNAVTSYINDKLNTLLAAHQTVKKLVQSAISSMIAKAVEMVLDNVPKIDVDWILARIQ